MIKILILGLLLCTALAGCSSSSDNEAANTNRQKGDALLPLGDYNVVMYDTNSVKLLDAVMRVEGYDSTMGTEMKTVKGSYKITKDYADFPGRSTMTGSFEGYLYKDKKSLYINTNPRIADANVYINFNINGRNLNGTWTYSTFRGPTMKGKATAVKK